MIVRDLEARDFPQLANLNAEDHKHDLPKPDSLLGIKGVFDGSSLLAIGLIDHIYEGVMMMHVGLSKSVKVEALKSLIEVAKLECKVRKINELIVFTKSDDFADLLTKHFEFNRVQEISLSLKIGEN